MDSASFIASLAKTFEERPQYEDSTNIHKGTPYHAEFTDKVLPWYSPVESKPSTNWKNKWRILRDRFERLVDTHQATECILVQTRIPLFHSKPINLPPDVRLDSVFLTCSGLSSEPARLLAPDHAPLKGEFPITGAHGLPLLSEKGENLAFRFGLRRQFLVQTGPNWIAKDHKIPSPDLSELARDGTTLLYQLPS